MSDGGGVSRRELFTFWRRRKEKEPAPPPDPLRPPGAVFDELLVDTCARCGKCVAACPRDAIRPLDASWGRARGTPAIVPREAPCVVCEGLACTWVCPSGALRRIAVFDVQMGTAELQPGRCLAFLGTPCSACVQACPVPGALAAVDGRPVVDPARCIGCGVCEHVCPTEPAAVTVAPARPIAR